MLQRYSNACDLRMKQKSAIDYFVSCCYYDIDKFLLINKYALVMIAFLLCAYLNQILFYYTRADQRDFIFLKRKFFAKLSIKRTLP